MAQAAAVMSIRTGGRGARSASMLLSCLNADEQLLEQGMGILEAWSNDAGACRSCGSTANRGRHHLVFVSVHVALTGMCTGYQPATSHSARHNSFITPQSATV